MEENKIAAAVQACLNDALKSEKPYRSINDALAMLNLHGWPEDERLVVQMQVLRD